MATYDETLVGTTNILSKHVELDRPIRPDDDITNDLGLDSLAVMEVVADIEDHFQINIPEEMLSKITTVADVAHALHELQNAEAAADAK
ncbi:phosphopantetheine-binding protein [Pendulispora brunnea]|uniref:Phosphopantetheine-binding protein n=1 Tax=Pendulispora brunnea TaxID=2905690 RepID=A0ABZ2KI74_9BACT